MNLADLKAPFDPKRISWRVGSTTADKTRGMALAYLDSRDVQDRLDAVCGPDGWACRYQLLGQTTVCEIGIKTGPVYVAGNTLNPSTMRLSDAEWVWKADGAGETDFEGQKGALSDAFKRAAVKWGIGRYLYDVDAPWVEIEPMGKSFKIKAKEMARLEAALKGEGMIAAAMAQPSPPAPLPPPQQQEVARNFKPSTPSTRPTAAQWAMSQIALLKAADSFTLSAWEDETEKDMKALRIDKPTLWEDVRDALSKRRTELAG